MKKKRQLAQRNRDIYTYGICFMLEVTEYFIHQHSEDDWLMKACDSRCTEAQKSLMPSSVLVAWVTL
jgi:hypothetical protein